MYLESVSIETSPWSQMNHMKQCLNSLVRWSWFCMPPNALRPVGADLILANVCRSLEGSVLLMLTGITPDFIFMRWLFFSISIGGGELLQVGSDASIWLWTTLVYEKIKSLWYPLVHQNRFWIPVGVWKRAPDSHWCIRFGSEFRLIHRNEPMTPRGASKLVLNSHWCTEAIPGFLLVHQIWFWISVCVRRERPWDPTGESIRFLWSPRLAHPPSSSWRIVSGGVFWRHQRHIGVAAVAEGSLSQYVYPGRWCFQTGDEMGLLPQRELWINTPTVKSFRIINIYIFPWD